MYAALAAEPYRLSPEQIGKLTDRQMWVMYVEPALRRHEGGEGAGRPGAAPASESPAPEPKTSPRRGGEGRLQYLLRTGLMKPDRVEEVLAAAAALARERLGRPPTEAEIGRGLRNTLGDVAADAAFDLKALTMAGAVGGGGAKKVWETVFRREAEHAAEAMLGG